MVPTTFATSSSRTLLETVSARAHVEPTISNKSLESVCSFPSFGLNDELRFDARTQGVEVIPFLFQCLVGEITSAVALYLLSAVNVNFHQRKQLKKHKGCITGREKQIHYTHQKGISPRTRAARRASVGSRKYRSVDCWEHPLLIKAKLSLDGSK